MTELTRTIEMKFRYV